VRHKFGGTIAQLLGVPIGQVVTLSPELNVVIYPQHLKSNKNRRLVGYKAEAYAAAYDSRISAIENRSLGEILYSDVRMFNKTILYSCYEVVLLYEDRIVTYNALALFELSLDGEQIRPIELWDPVIAFPGGLKSVLGIKQMPLNATKRNEPGDIVTLDEFLDVECAWQDCPTGYWSDGNPGSGLCCDSGWNCCMVVCTGNESEMGDYYWNLYTYPSCSDIGDGGGGSGGGGDPDPGGGDPGGGDPGGGGGGGGGPTVDRGSIMPEWMFVVLVPYQIN